MPPGGQSGERPVPSTSTPGGHRGATEVCMDVYHMRDLEDGVMVGADLYSCINTSIPILD